MGRAVSDCRCASVKADLCAEADYWLAPVAGHPYLEGLPCPCACHAPVIEVRPVDTPSLLAEPVEVQLGAGPATQGPDAVTGPPEPPTPVTGLSALEAADLAALGEDVGLRREVRDEAQESLFGDTPLEEWRTHWWGMPSFTQGDARPAYRMTVNFMTPEDVADFATRLGVRATTRTDSLWYPAQVIDQPNQWEYVE